MFILDVIVVNFYILFKLKNSKSKITHKLWQQKISLILMRNSVERLRTALKNNNNSNSANSVLKHKRKYLEKLQYCTLCRVNKRSFSRKDRKSLDLINVNKRRRESKSTYECTHDVCINIHACRIDQCWLKMYSRHELKYENLSCRDNFLKSQKIKKNWWEIISSLSSI